MSDSTLITPPDPPAPRHCPACAADATNNVTSSGYCLGCGHDLISTAPRLGWQRGVDLRVVARNQRRVNYLALVLFTIFVLAIVAPNVAPLGTGRAARVGMSMVSALGVTWSVVSVISSVVALVFVAQLMTSMNRNVVVIVIYAILALAPCFNILVMLSASSQATALLRLAGLKIGVLGVSDEQILRMLAPNRCRACGYILVRGVLTKNCPECGAAVVPGA